MGRQRKRTVKIGNELYDATVFVIRSVNQDGSPGLVEHIRDDDRIDVSKLGNDEFLIAYVPRKMLKRPQRQEGGGSDAE